MEFIVRELAEAHGLKLDLDALRAMCAGPGLRDKWDLLKLPASIRERLFGNSGTNEASLEACWGRVLELVEAAPPEEQPLLEAAFNLGGDTVGWGWPDRLAALARRTDKSMTDIALRVDLALLQLLLRLRPAAEEVPAPTAVPAPAPVDQAGRAAQFFNEDYVTNTNRFRTAWGTSTQVDMWGFGHNRMSVAYSREMQSLLARGGQIRVLLQDPEGTGVIEANQRSSTPKASDEAVRYQHRAGVVTLQAIAEGSRSRANSLQIRYFSGMPPFTAYFFDADQRSAICFIWLWSWRQPSSWRPGFYIKRETDELWFERFRQQFLDLWECCDDNIIPAGGAT